MTIDETPPPGPTDSETGSGALPALRHSRLLHYLQDRSQATVAELVTLLEVSRDTVRRDLDLLERRGLLVRTHGGAVTKDRLVRVDTTMGLRMDEHVEAKRRIGQEAANLIRDDETLILNGGSTICFFAAALGGRRNLTIVTNNLRLPAVVPEGSIQSIHILGGSYWPNYQVTIGAIGFAAVAGIHVDTAVIGCSGVSASGISMTKLDEAAHTAGMIGVASRTIVVADQSKFGITAFANIVGLDEIACLVTDSLPPPDLAAALERAGVQVIVCGD
ncbi:DeoR/GlpR family DNA-binding transcription regulator [Kaistia terrae]|uniref:DeoR/GlpR family DNA-binding transcription regulator n=1 Tax=Kaistia terrae TaxID=537017 RepID=A0ABW0PTC9_9HYPH|nr:DeoR/GlpR family DNA-binding transcription regulator [Kaistia terrae]MCX5577595.1 DeoR/GlpR family DNA-binding transcription regulator [Kaistia terrae]